MHLAQKNYDLWQNGTRATVQQRWHRYGFVCLDIMVCGCSTMLARRRVEMHGFVRHFLLHPEGMSDGRKLLAMAGHLLRPKNMFQAPKTCPTIVKHFLRWADGLSLHRPFNFSTYRPIMRHVIRRYDVVVFARSSCAAIATHVHRWSDM